jgi:hypothetical protein
MIRVIKSLWRWRAVLLVAFVVGNSHIGNAQTTNIIWKADFRGLIGIQQHTPTLERVMQQAKYKTGDFLKMILGSQQPTNLVLALNINVQGGATNLFLSVYNTVTRQNLYRVTTNEVSVLLEDNKQYSSSTSTAIAGGRGELQIAGRGIKAHGYPITMKAQVKGYLIDPFPSDIGGTTGTILRATLKTSGKPLRVEPPYIPPSL